jgi:DNA-binding NtrC family response regulator
MQTVLVFDADAQERDMVVTMLHEEGFAALSPANAEGGFALLRQGGIDAVVLPAGNDEESINLLIKIRATFPTMAVVVIARNGCGVGARDPDATPLVGVVPFPFNRAQIASVLVRVQLASESRQERLVFRCLR